jgi:hypothetical protein
MIRLNYVIYMATFGCWDSAVGTATGYGAGRPKGRNSSLGRVKNFHFSTSSIQLVGPTQPPLQWVSMDLSQGVRRHGGKGDYSPQTIAEVKKLQFFTHIPLYVFMAQLSIS